MFALILASACGGGQSRESRLNVRPPRPGVPDKITDVTGIYRTTSQATLQLRGDGSLSFIVPAPEMGATSGSYRLDSGAFEVRTRSCGELTGNYRIEVRGRQVAGEAFLVFSAEDDPCTLRERYLTLQPWFYADS